MTRKAARKRRQQAAKHQSHLSSALRPGFPWATIGTLLASTAIGGLLPGSASAHELGAVATTWRSPGTPFNAFAVFPDGPRGQSAAASAIHQFAIAPGPLAEIIPTFEAVTGMDVTLAIDSIGSLPSPGVSGSLTSEQALQAFLAGTSVRFRLTSPAAAVLELAAQAESVEVNARVSGALVSSPKYMAPLRDIPQTIEVIPREAMEAQGVTTLSEALRNVPGITLQAGEGGGASSTAGDMFNMRGFNAANSLFVDNVRDDGLVSRDVYNLEQVEVFMGPTGSDVGRGTAAGYVNMQTKTPHLPAARAATLVVGAAGQRRGSIDVNQPLAPGNGSWIGNSAVRFNALWQDSGVAGRDEVHNGTKAFSPALGLGLGTGTRVLASAQVLRQHNLPDYGIPGGAWSRAPLAPATVLAARPVDQRNYYGSPAYDYDDADQNTVTARVEHTLTQRITVSNQTRYNRTTREAVISTVQSPTSYVPATELVTIARQGNARENEITSNQTSLTGRVPIGRLEHSVSAGFELTRESQFAPTLTGMGTRAPVNIYNPNPSDPITGYAVSRTSAFTDGKTDTAALYAFDSIPLGPRVQVNGGMRFEHYSTDFRSVDAASVSTVKESGSDGLLSGKAGVVVRARRNGNVYLSYGTTVTPPGSANFTLSAAPNNQNNPNVKPQRSANLEAGTKWDTAGARLSLNAAVFHTINENVLFTVDSAAVPPVYNQDDKQRVDGVTLGATGQITPRWQILASAGYLDSKSLTQNAANNGRRLTLSPKFSGSMWTTYRLQRRWTLGGGVRGTGKVFINAANTISAPGYRVVDGLVEYAINAHLTMRLNVYNLTDTVYIRNVNNNGGRYNPGNPRTAQVTSVVAF